MTSRDSFQFDMTSFKFILSSTLVPQHLQNSVQAFIRNDPDGTAAFVKHAWTVAIRGFLSTHGSTPSWEWQPLFQYLIENGADPHEGDRWHNTGSLSYFLSRSSCPLEAEDIVRKWLKILESCGVDIASYLTREVPRCLRMGLWDDRRLFVPCQYGSLPGLSWVWNLDKDSNAVAVLREFRNLVSFKWRIFGIRQSVSHREWKQPQTNCWPYVFVPVADGVTDHHHGGTTIEGIPPWRVDDRANLRKAQQIYHERSARRQAKRLSKGQKRYKPLAMPGAWVE